MNNLDFEGFGKIARLSRDIVITEKIDGTNAQIYIGEGGEFLIGSRKRWITPEVDNFGFAQWCMENKDELLKLGPGRHFGEWWGCGIQRGYGLNEKRFSLFNTSRWADAKDRPGCCDVVPVLYSGQFNQQEIDGALDILWSDGSVAAPGFMEPEGIMIWHTAARVYFKKTILNDEVPKSVAARAA